MGPRSLRECLTGWRAALIVAFIVFVLPTRATAVTIVVVTIVVGVSATGIVTLLGRVVRSAILVTVDTIVSVVIDPGGSIGSMICHEVSRARE